MLVNERKHVISGLLEACLRNLQSQGMKKMFLDGVSSELDFLEQLGWTPEFNTLQVTDQWKDSSNGRNIKMCGKKHETIYSSLSHSLNEFSGLPFRYSENAHVQ